MDAHGRNIDYLRISITDRCNERCLYCMPEGYKGWETTRDHLTAEEIIRVVRIAAGIGFRKFRLTGGEPLVRRDILDVVQGMKQVPGVEDVGLSTNGTKLGPLAGPLRAAGVRSVNVSLDALDPGIYRRVTGGDLDLVLAGIRAASTSGFERIKLNCVLMRGVNENEIWPLVLFAAEHGFPLRFIELMPLTRTEVLTEENFFPIGDAMRLLSGRDELVPQPGARIGHGPAAYYLLRHTGALVGFIGALTNLHFCDQCNKMRLTSDGKIRPCLGNHGELDLRAVLREGGNDEALRAVFLEALRIKPLEHEFRNQYQPQRPMTAIGG
ncbi:MAG TPA: GTP 3',8-cyclase MoaA [Candidatus Sulfotelmatobacter sp.]|nr:GTP 3',8-cyclase MoaA [Candidatus Sulfotelmatobacter sp.]